eukprot:6195241-Pleurochrysis_carterae.AAC.2
MIGVGRLQISQTVLLAQAACVAFSISPFTMSWCYAVQDCFMFRPGPASRSPSRSRRLSKRSLYVSSVAISRLLRRLASPSLCVALRSYSSLLRSARRYGRTPPYRKQLLQGYYCDVSAPQRNAPRHAAQRSAAHRSAAQHFAARRSVASTAESHRYSRRRRKRPGSEGPALANQKIA